MSGELVDLLNVEDVSNKVVTVNEPGQYTPLGDTQQSWTALETHSPFPRKVRGNAL